MPRPTCLIIVAIALARPVSALELTEIVWSSAQDGAWETPGNWSTGVLPTSDDFAYLNDPVVVTSEGANFAGELLNHADLRISGGTFDVALGTIDTFGSIAVTNDAAVTVSRIYVQASGSFDVNGAETSVSVVEGIFTSGLFLAQAGTSVAAESLDNFATMTLTSGAVITANSMINHPAALVTVSGLASQLHIDGNLTNDGTVRVGGKGTVEARSIDNRSAIEVAADGSVKVQTLENHHSVEVRGDGAVFAATSLVTNHGSLDVRDDATSDIAGLVNKGQATFNDSRATGGALDNGDGATFSLLVSELSLRETAVNQGNVVIDATSALTAEAYLQKSGSTLLLGGTLGATDARGVHIAGGSLLGQGVIDGKLLTSLSGIASPGTDEDATASFDIAGDLALGGIFEVQLASIAAFDYLDAEGAATLGGKLRVSLIDDFAPQLGDHFDIVLASAMNGGFGEILLPTLGDGLVFSTVTGADFFRLQIVAAPVPLPAAWWLMIPAIAALGVARRTAPGVAVQS